MAEKKKEPKSKRKTLAEKIEELRASGLTLEEATKQAEKWEKRRSYKEKSTKKAAGKGKVGGKGKRPAAAAHGNIISGLIAAGKNLEGRVAAIEKILNISAQ